MKITIIAGARPNFMKIAPIIHAFQKESNDKFVFDFRLVHTGQHYDAKMSDTFFKELNIPHPHVNLEAGGGSQAEQTAAIMIAFESELIQNPTDLVLVVGDVTSTMACAIVAKKLNTKVAHVEAGIRSFDLSMPEEINRMVTDRLTDYYFTTSKTANQNLTAEGVDKEKIFFVGNVMIDTLKENINKFFAPQVYHDLKLSTGKYFVITLHRPANVDETESLLSTLREIIKHSDDLPVIFPIHPRTAKIFSELNVSFSNLHTILPLGYLEFNYLVQNAKAVITDSGGITEETTVMGIPCLTLRDNTERPETISIGTNELVGTNPENIGPALARLKNGEWKKGGIPELWDGKAALRIANVIKELYEH